jgi:hypothetical protein
VRMGDPAGVVCAVLWGVSSRVRRPGRESETVVLVEVAWDGLS